MANTYSAGIVTAYGAAKKAGYTGTYEEFCAEQASFARNAQQVRQDKESVEQTVETFSETTVPAAVQSVTDEGTAQVGLVTDAGTTAVGNVNDAGTTKVSEVNQAGATQVGNVNTAGDNQVSAVNSAGQTQVGNVNDAGTTQVGNVQNEGATQVQAVEDKGAEVLETIPSDYTALSALVDKKAPVIINNASGPIASFDDGADDMKIQKLVVNIEPVQAGSGDPSPDNVRPISGWTGAEISNAAVNVWDEEWRNGKYVNGVFRPDQSYFANKNFIPVKPSTSYYIGSDTASTWVISFYDKNKEFISIIQRTNERFSTPDNCYYINFNGITTYYGTTYQNDIRINYPSTDTTYRPYRGKQISVLFPSAAGIVYSGLLTLNPDRTGALVVNGASAVYDGSNDEAWLGEGSGAAKYFRIGIGEKNSVIDNEVISNIYKQADITGSTIITGINVLNSTAYNISQIMVRPANVQDLTIADFKALLAETPMQVYWKLTSPQTFQLTAEEISGILSTLYGTNNIWADTGDVTVTAPKDTKLYIDGKLAEIQATILENIGG